ncbi:MAG: DNA repair protein RadA [Cyclobacteriaceae bacterium]|nr:DNA repair protein RadA [Cyclobacteriaceae bacterium]MDW8330840.1 DNA repair protein RadA [Cyclobacteriaceae bacterium]
MPKTKTLFFCQNCGHESPKWMGRCPACNQWNTFVEEVVVKTPAARHPSAGPAKPVLLHDIDSAGEYRIVTPDAELNRVLGGGLVPGSLVLIGGEPGIGKSTLLLQLALHFKDVQVLYVSGEESGQQIKMRADRLKNNSIATGHIHVFTETQTQGILKAARELNPGLLIIDSIQTLYSDLLDSAAGSIAQVRQSTAELMRFAKETATPVFIIGHITKDGTLAGPKVLEHMVDTVLQFEGDQHLAYRILRTTKNRFGSTSELGIYEMRSSGLREVSNPSEILISQKDGPVSGTTIAATLEGNRPLLIEVQSLVSPASYGTPQRSTTGFDHKRLNMLLAVLEKRCGYRMGMHDVFVNLAGGIKVEDPALDLSLCVSLVSSLEELPVSEKICFAAEVGLGGELRAVNRMEQRIAEAEKLGFETLYVSRFSLKNIDHKKITIRLKAFGKLTEVFADLFGSL